MKLSVLRVPYAPRGSNEVYLHYSREKVISLFVVISKVSAPWLFTCVQPDSVTKLGDYVVFTVLLAELVFKSRGSCSLLLNGFWAPPSIFISSGYVKEEQTSIRARATWIFDDTSRACAGQAWALRLCGCAGQRFWRWSRVVLHELRFVVPWSAFVVSLIYRYIWI